MSNMLAQLDNMHIDDLPYLERDITFPQKVSLLFLLFGDQHAQATYLLQKLLALTRAPHTEQQNTDLLRQFASVKASHEWRGHIIEALCLINARQVLRKLGFRWEELRLHYLPHVQELTLHIHPLLKAMYIICEQLTLAQTGRLVLNINEKLAQQQEHHQHEPLRFYDSAYLEIFLLDWLTRHHVRLGDINAMGSDVQLLIEYFKMNDMQAQATLLVETVNSNAVTGAERKCETDTSNATPHKVEAVPRQRHENSYQISRQNAGILLIVNQQRFHANVSEELQPLLPRKPLSAREGTDVDKRRLSEVFSALGYQVESFDNLDHLDMLEHIRNVCARSTLRDSLVVCILSHGFMGAVYGSDSVPVAITDIKNVLCADESLNDKPKLLIIQACQENEKQNLTRQVNVTTDSPSNLANMVVAMSTVPGFVALRHNIQGSWFVQTLCDEIEQHAASAHVLDLLTIVIGQISQKRGDKNQIMLPHLNSTLKQSVYLPSI
ncbi:caspase-8 [Drosophila busckii]|uniref:caspase-8 n=1 Tax=Drosophila busckii TaxID=30019 RepID=UPI00083EA726|nr:caspase-8 [Drosophila busckii]